MLLKEVHVLGKDGANVFSSAQNFSHMLGTGEVNSHPIVSFKAHLVRLIGNLCHKHIANQNKVCSSLGSLFNNRVLLFMLLQNPLGFLISIK